MATKNPCQGLGLKTKNREKDLQVWVYEGVVIIMDPKQKGKDVDLVGKIGETAYFLENNTGKLYQQEIIDQTILKNAFGRDYVLDLENNLFPSTIAVLPDEQFETVSIGGNGSLKLVTKNHGGAILMMRILHLIPRPKSEKL